MMFDTRINVPALSEASQSKALRAFGWSELTARINAARDFRMSLAQEDVFGSASFGDAAAGYFSHGEQGKPRVNPDALEGRKACHGMNKAGEGRTTTGDLRDFDD